MKIVFYFLFVILLTGCLVPGAPQYFNFESKNSQRLDSLVVISFPNHIDYQYWQNDVKLM